MKKQKFSNRIAIRIMIAVAALTLLMFSAIYFVVFRTVYNHLDDDLNAESLEVHNSIVMLSDQLVFANPNEWLENEHGQIEVNPTFIQVADSLGHAIKKTPNLVGDSLKILPDETTKIFFNTTLSGVQVRQLQVPLTNFRNNRFGYLSVAIPLEDSQLVLTNLRTVLILLIPLVFLVIFFVSRFIAQNSIKPIQVLTRTTEKITRKNLDERIPLPASRDELFVLTQSINSLLDRIGEALERERQFTSDASHELRTPLSVIRGNLELMLRKERDPSYYLVKSRASMKEVDRMSDLIDKLLLLARYDNPPEPVKPEYFDLSELIQDLVIRFDLKLKERRLHVKFTNNKSFIVNSNRFMMEQIVENIFMNAVKFTSPGGLITIKLNRQNSKTCLSIADEGPGIPKGQQKSVFDRFYRTDASRSSGTGGNGLGLAIVKRFSDLLDINISIDSEEGKGTTFLLEL